MGYGKFWGLRQPIQWDLKVYNVTMESMTYHWPRELTVCAKERRKSLLLSTNKMSGRTYNYMCVWATGFQSRRIKPHSMIKRPQISDKWFLATCISHGSALPSVLSSFFEWLTHILSILCRRMKISLTCSSYLLKYWATTTPYQQIIGFRIISLVSFQILLDSLLPDGLKMRTSEIDVHALFH